MDYGVLKNPCFILKQGRLFFKNISNYQCEKIPRKFTELLSHIFLTRPTVS